MNRIAKIFIAIFVQLPFSLYLLTNCDHHVTTSWFCAGLITFATIAVFVHEHKHPEKFNLFHEVTKK